MFFRLHYNLSTGEPPKIITEDPKHRHFAPYLNMYDLWFQARFAERNTPTYDEFKSIYEPIKEKYIAKHR